MTQIVASPDLDRRPATPDGPGRARPGLVTGPRLVLAALVIGALVLRWQFRDFTTGDYRAFLDPWYRHLQQASGLSGLADVNSNYNTPYLVLLALISKTPIPELVAIKSISVVFDLLLVFFAFKIVALVRPGSRWLPTIAAGVALFLPTVVMNSSVWGQCDAIYASLCLGSLYFLIRREAWAACALFGLAFAFKLQAVFFAPVLLGVLVVNRMRIRALISVPVVFFVAMLPAALAGRSLLTQLMTYPSQITGGSTGGGGGRSGGVGGMPGGAAGGGVGRAAGQTGQAGGFQPGTGGGQFAGGPGGGPSGMAGGGAGGGGSDSLTDNAPTWYAWLSADASSVWKYVGLGLAALVAVVFAVVLLRRHRRLGPAEILLLAAASTLIIPLLLPDMHERYFYLAEVLSVLAIFVGRGSGDRVGSRGWIAVAALIQVATISTYLTYLADTTYVPLGISAVAAMTAAVVAAVLLLRALRKPSSTDSAADPAPDRVEGSSSNPVGVVGGVN